MKLTKESLVDARHILNLEQEQFADLLHISKSYLSKLETGAVSISPKLEIKLQLRLRQIMEADSDFGGVGDQSVLYASGQKVSKSLIPYFDVDVMATPMEVFNDQTTSPTYKIDMPGFSDCTFAINVYGNSMYPTIESGTIILCKKVEDRTLIIPGEVYFVVTKDYRMVKRLLKSEKKGYVIASSDNHNGHNSPDGKTYGSTELPMDKILHLYIVKGNIKRHHT